MSLDDLSDRQPWAPSRPVRRAANGTFVGSIARAEPKPDIDLEHYEHTPDYQAKQDVRHAKVRALLTRIGPEGLDDLRRASLAEGDSFTRTLAAIAWAPERT